MSSTRFETILYEKSGPVARLTMNRPERLNGMTNRMLVETRSALAAAAEDRELRVLVLTGAGKGFCPGADISLVASAAPDDPLTVEDFRVPILLHDMPAVTIAAINGACAGAGLGWALACDFRFAAESARFNVAFQRRWRRGRYGRSMESLANRRSGARSRTLFPSGQVRRRRGAEDWTRHPRLS